MKRNIKSIAIALAAGVLLITGLSFVMSNSNYDEKDMKILSLIDNVVALEENLQKANITELYRGDEKWSEMKELVMCNANPSTSERAKLLIMKMEQINKITARRIKLIDELKKGLLEECGEDVSLDITATIITKPWNPKTENKPTRFNLMNVKVKDNNVTPSKYMGVDNYRSPEGKALELWKEMNDYRNELIAIIASSNVITDTSDRTGVKKVYDERYHFDAPLILEYTDYREVVSKLRSAMNESKVHRDDEQVIIDLFLMLNHREYETIGNADRVHWMGRTFYKQTLVGALSSLTVIQGDLLRSRATAMTQLRSKVASCRW